VIFWQLAERLIPIIFGGDYAVDGNTVGVLVMSTLICQLADSMTEYLIGQRKVFADIASRIMSMVALAAFGVWLAPKFGLIGIAVAMGIGEFLRWGYLIKRVSFETKKPVVEFWRIKWSDIDELLNRKRIN
jgi:O-antigen/teichoic acid export membrane protein